MSFDLKFPQKTTAKNDFIDTLRLLGLYKKSLFEEFMDQMVAHNIGSVGQPNQLLINSKVFAQLTQQLKSSK